jgi:hypothetical protein
MHSNGEEDMNEIKYCPGTLTEGFDNTVYSGTMKFYK